MERPDDLEETQSQELTEREKAILEKREAILERERTPSFDEYAAENPRPVDQIEGGGELSMTRDQLCEYGKEEGTLSRPEVMSGLRPECIPHGAQVASEKLGFAEECDHHTYNVSGYDAATAEGAMDSAATDLESMGFERDQHHWRGYGSDGDHIGNQDGAEYQLWRDNPDGTTQEHLRIRGAEYDHDSGKWTVKIEGETPDRDDEIRQKLEEQR